MTDDNIEIESILHENRRFTPALSFAAQARLRASDLDELYAAAKQDYEGFWCSQAQQELQWKRPFTRTLNADNAPHYRWFEDGTLNVSFNCLDRHLTTQPDKVAVIFEGEKGDQRTLTYRQLHREVCRFASGLLSLGIRRGDRVVIYMPMTPELVIAMLACARIGVVHSVIFGGFSSEAIADRNNDAKARLVITADYGWRRGQELPLKKNVDEALTKSPTVEHCIVLKRTGNPVHMKEGRDHWWHHLTADISDDCPATPLDSETPLAVCSPSRGGACRVRAGVAAIPVSAFYEAEPVTSIVRLCFSKADATLDQGVARLAKARDLSIRRPAASPA